MKFFSNEKETDTHDDPDRTQTVSSDPVGVPPQRAGSPWSDAPVSSDDTSSDTARVDDESKTTTTYGPDGTVVEDTDYRPEHADRTTDSQVDLPLGDEPADKKDEPVDAALKDDGTFDSPKVVDSDSDSDASSLSSDRADAVASVPADSPDPVEADRPASGDTSTDSTNGVVVTDNDTVDEKADGYRDGEEFQPATDTPVVAAAAVPVATTTPTATAATSTATGTTGERLLPDGDSYAERFREIQLRFVDEPKAATAEAAELVGDAVDKLTSALKAQRDSLGGNADDTEKLRVELRAYRDIINRLTQL
ncbi:hypothetical protein KOI35_39225 [Actinoplanes bogorensis]|uniref:Uncharacterized protein n=1 Tax=Paractinoplanes bogorensis TaxID=1610840 RepID=A0ABS5Z1I9_9ACTN|nr:hypothetical protein [Actinoplanes bogorensis]MBU2669560.1 hypothetical protein [Actinoplanes bogorensis]